MAKNHAVIIDDTNDGESKELIEKEKALRHSQSFYSVFFRLSPSSDEVSGKPFKD